MKTLYPPATWLTLAAAAVLLALAASDVHAQTRVVRPVTTSFPTVGNPRWYTQTNWSSYSNPNNYVNYSYLNTFYNPYPRYYTTYVRTSTLLTLRTGPNGQSCSVCVAVLLQPGDTATDRNC